LLYIFQSLTDALASISVGGNVEQLLEGGVLFIVFNPCSSAANFPSHNQFQENHAAIKSLTPAALKLLPLDVL
jgi:hypothetical protein